MANAEFNRGAPFAGNDHALPSKVAQLLWSVAMQNVVLGHAILSKLPFWPNGFAEPHDEPLNTT